MMKRNTIWIWAMCLLLLAASITGCSKSCSGQTSDPLETVPASEAPQPDEGETITEDVVTPVNPNEGNSSPENTAPTSPEAPIETEAPTSPDEPIVTEAPDNTEEPDATDDPLEIEIPITTPEPTPTPKPGETAQPTPPPTPTPEPTPEPETTPDNGPIELPELP